MRNQEGGAPFEHAAQRLLDVRLGFHIHGGKRVIENFDRRVLHEHTGDGDALTLTLAINYGGRDEIARAAGRAAREALERGKKPGDADFLDQDAIARNHDAAELPDPDRIIRTAGEERLSNFLIWQAAYAELLFCPRPWPDFSDQDFADALAEYGRRVRKFGGEGTT